MATKGQKLLAAGTAALIAEPALALAHTGGVGAIVGLVVGAIAYVAVEDVERMAGRELPLPAPQSTAFDTEKEQATLQGRHHYSLAYRIFNGKSTRENFERERDEDDQQQAEQYTRNGRETKATKLVDLADDLHLDVDEIAGKATFIVGMRRSGKTTIGTRLAEQLGGKFHLPLFIPDLEGDYLSLADAGILPQCVIAGHPDAYDPRAGYLYANIDSITDAQVLGYDILESGLQVILDMGSYDTVERACEMIVNIIKGIFAWTKRNPTELCPCEIYLDEAQRFLPENLGDSLIQDAAILNALLKAYMDILAVGGKRGLTPVILSQRFAQKNKKIFAQSEVQFIMRQTNDLDLARCMQYVKKSIATPEQIATFAQGQGVYIGADGTQRVTRFSPRESDGGRSCTPKAAVAMRYADKQPYSGPTASSYRDIPAHVSEHEDVPQQKEVAHLPQPIIPEKDTRPMASDIDLAEAIEAYNNGATSRRKLAERFGMAENQGANLLRRIEEARELA